jgi:hypothetical protein
VLANAVDGQVPLHNIDIDTDGLTEYSVSMRVRSLPPEGTCEMRIEIGQLRATGKAAIESTGGGFGVGEEVVDDNYDFNSYWSADTTLNLANGLPATLDGTGALNIFPNPFSVAVTLEVGENNLEITNNDLQNI